MSVEQAIIGGSGLILLVFYVVVSVREGTYIHALTPFYALFFPIYCLIELAHVSFNGPSASTYAYALSYLSYVTYVAAFSLSYTFYKGPGFIFPQLGKKPIPQSFCWCLLFLSCLIYWPVLKAFPDLWLTPRQIYEQTRSGFGLYFFLSTTLCYVAIICFLTTEKKNVVLLTLFIAASLIFLWLHGTKGHFIAFFFIYSIYWVYGKSKKVTLSGLLIYSSGMLVIGVVSFLITTAVLVLDDGVNNLLGFADYNRNGMNAIDSEIGPKYGTLTLENQTYPRVPCALFSDKPQDFGEFYLAKMLTPDDFYRGSGAPSFGYGSIFVDFMWLSPFVMLVWGAVRGVFLKMTVRSYRKNKDPGSLIMLLFGAGIQLIPFSETVMFFETIFLGLLANLGRMRLIKVAHLKSAVIKRMAT